MRVLALLLLTTVLIASGPALAGKKDKSHGKNHHTSSNEETVNDVIIEGLISAAERLLINEYVDRNPGSFHGTKALPPGIAKKIARGRSLPPGIAKKGLPRKLSAQLPPRRGAEWHVVGTDVVLVEIATKVIIDVLKDAL
jgi:Ni/Co efflux regulator RcnB